MAPNIQPRENVQMPMIGYGTGTAWFKPPGSDGIDRALIESIKTAIRLGYRHLDGAEVYGTEIELGIAIEESGIPRRELFVTTKIMTRMTNISEAFDDSLKKLKLDYVDAYLLHEPYFAKTPEELQSAWSTMEDLYASGRAKSIGVSNFLPSHLDTILQTAKVKPAVNQIEFNPYLQQSAVIAFANEHKIKISAHSPLTPLTSVRPGPVDEVIKRLAEKYGVSESVILLRWVVSQGIAVITTSSKEERLKDYLDNVFGAELLQKEVEEIRTQGSKLVYRGFHKEHFPDEQP